MDNNVLDKRSYDELNKAIELAQHTVYKRYLTELKNYPLVEPTLVFKDEDASHCLIFFQIEELTYKKGEDIFQKLSTVYHASMLLGCSVGVIIDVESNNAPAKIYLGVRNNGEDNAALRASSDTLKNGIISNFPGTKFNSMQKQNKMQEMLDNIFEDHIDENGKTIKNHIRSISSVSCVASVRDKTKTENKAFIQGIERFIDAMQGNSYTAIFIAEPISEDELAEVRSGYENLYSTLSSFGKSIWSYNENESKAVMESLSEGISDSVSEGTNSTQAHTNSSGWNMGLNFGGSSSSGKSSTISSPTGMGALSIIGTAVSAAVPLVGGALAAAGAIGGVLKGASTASGVVSSIGKTLGMFGAVNRGKADTESDGATKIDTKGKTRTETSGTTDTAGTGRTLQIENTNKPIQEMLKRIEEQLKRTQEG
ncbi:MAG: hypothetical protein LIO44_00075 [Eubacterium sp.]|nr:hypothetical protein [Eubacterium sp.]